MLNLLATLLRWLIERRDKGEGLSDKDRARVAKVMGLTDRINGVADFSFGIQPDYYE